jgi:iron-sulfur cluster repair protein YtfE (RIC family)
MTVGTTRDPSAAMLLELHHRRLDDMLDDVERMADNQSWQDAKRRFEVFRLELEAHIRLEEELMFPAFGQDAQMLRGPIMVMLAEHAAIKTFLEEVGRALREERAIDRATSELEAQLGTHNIKEERVLYPAFERVAPAGLRAALAAKVEALVRGPG